MQFKPSTDPEVLIDINTTPLIDVMLVLLIMLIVTIPVQLHAVNMQLPITAPTRAQETPQVARIDIDRAGQVRWNDETLADHAALEQQLANATKLTPAPELQIRASTQVQYLHVVAVLAAAQRQGINRISIRGE